LALPQAERFYVKLGFEKVRMDAEAGLFYYEWAAKIFQNNFDIRNNNDISND